MASFEHALLCAAAMTVVWTLFGLPISSRLFAAPAAALYAPALGFAIQSVITLPLFWCVGMSRLAVLMVTIACLVGAVATIRTQSVAFALSLYLPLSLVAAIAAAALLALVPAAAALPKATSDGVTLAASIFDHSKVAMIEEMVRAGVPPQNPFIGETGAPDRLAYYYLWHFSAAAFAVLTGVGGWEADAALTWFTAFASLLTMFGLTVRLGATAAAPFLVLVLAASASVRALLESIVPTLTSAFLTKASGLGAWLFQTAWAPQHVASATFILLACLLLAQVARVGGWFAPAIFGLVAAAGYQASTWVGGVTFVVSALAVGLYVLWSLTPPQRLGFAMRAVSGATLALVLSLPFLLDQAIVASARGGGFPITVAPVTVLGPAVPASFRPLLDLPAYWLLYLPVELVAFYPAGVIGLFVLIKDRSVDAPAMKVVMPLVLVTAASLGVGWLLRSVVAYNNDLGWRAVLPAILLLIVFAATVISRWPRASARIAVVLAVLGVVLALPDTFQLVREDLFASRTLSERQFAASPAMWQAVRRYTAPGERIANNPAFLGDATPWPVNISWALLANRRSCYAGDDLAIAFVPASAQHRAATKALFDRVFAGTPVTDDVRQIADRYRCDVVVVTPQDGAWQSDPFASGDLYRLVEIQDNGWRIYRRTQMPANQLKPRSSQ